MTTNTPQRKKDLSITKSGGQAVLIEKQGNQVHVLNKTALEVWNILDGTKSIADIAKIIRSKFSVPENRDVEKDVNEIINQFKQLGLLSYSISED